MLHRNTIRQFVEARVPGAHVQISYHGCYQVTVEVFHPGSGHGSGNPLYQISCASEGFGAGKLNILPSTIVRGCRERLAAAT